MEFQNNFFNNKIILKNRQIALLDPISVYILVRLQALYKREELFIFSE
jgi:hypothetical protein